MWHSAGSGIWEVWHFTSMMCKLRLERELLGKESGQASITIGLDFELQQLQGAFEEWGSEKHLLSAEFEKYASGKRRMTQGKQKQAQKEVLAEGETKTSREMK